MLSDLSSCHLCEESYVYSTGIHISWHLIHGSCFDLLTLKIFMYKIYPYINSKNSVMAEGKVAYAHYRSLFIVPGTWYFNTPGTLPVGKKQDL